MDKINLAEKFSRITEHWRPKATRNTGNVEHATLTAPDGVRI
jgi:hypothetical protein